MPTDPGIRWLAEATDLPISLVGGKGANLARLVQQGLPVPPGFVITTALYRAFLTANHLAEAHADTLSARIPQMPIPPELSRPIIAAYERLGAACVAVRSSGTAEDLATASFAGQHDTFLNVSGAEALLTAVKDCWASLWSARAVAYRRQHGWDATDVAIAVVVQAMVPAQWAGALFTADPISGRRDRMLIDAVAGLGEPLVSGAVVSRRAVIEKPGQRLLTNDTAIPPTLLTEIARLGVQIETAFQAPQDIEWAIADGRVAIVQARALTALPDDPAARPSSPKRRYSRLQRLGAPNAMEHMPVPPYPFDYALFYRPEMEHALRALQALGFAVPPIHAVYVEVAEGVIQMVPPAIRPTLRALALPAKLVRALRADPAAWLAECRTTLVAAAEQIDQEPLAPLSEGALLARIERLQQLQATLVLRRFGLLVPGLLVSQLFSLLLRLAVGRQHARPLEAALLAGVPCTTTASNQELGRLARLIRDAAAVRQVFVAEPPTRIADQLRRIPAGGPILTEIEAFLQRFGFRESAMPAAALPAWRDDPTIVYGLLKGLVTGAQETTALDANADDRAARATQELCAALTHGWFGSKRRILLRPMLRLLAASRATIAFREDSHYFLFMVFPVIRRLALALGDRLTARGLLEQADDIFFLTLAEIIAPRPAEQVRILVARRKAARQAVAGRYTAVPAVLLEQVPTKSGVRGVAASPGQAIGRVKIIRGSHEFWKLTQGEVLVAPYTNPTWTPLFALASGVVVDAGSAASHAAIVAREYGIPAVMGTGTATGRFHDGQRVLVDGTAGTVVPLGTDEDSDQQHLAATTSRRGQRGRGR